MTPIRVYFRDNEILIDSMPMALVAGSLEAALGPDGATVQIMRVDSEYALTSLPWQSVAAQDGSTFASPDDVMAYLATQFAMRRPVGAVLTVMAGMDIGGHKALMFDPAGSGAPVYADPDAEDYVFAGLALGAATAGDPVIAIMAGLVTEPSWSWTPLQPVYVGAAGALTQDPPESGLFHLLGFAATATSILLAPAPLVYLA